MHLVLKSVILGVIQGLTEFLPISSTGHMIIVDEYLHLPAGFRETFLVVVQLGSILSVLVYFWKRFLIKEALSGKLGFMRFLWFWLKICAGVLPALVVGGLFGSMIKEKLYSVITVSIALFIGGILLLFLESIKRIPKYHSIELLPWSKAICIGIAQCLAMIPGVSRSAATIIGALALGTSKELAVEYSFFLAIPTMFAASAYSLLKEGSAMSSGEWIATAAGFVTAFAVALGVIALFMSYIRKKDFKIFGWYRIALAIVLLIWLAFLK